MNWYYAAAGQQKGPVSDMEFTTLIRDGAINGKTLVWREGQAEWSPLEIIRPDLLVPANTPVLGGVPVVGANKDILVQQMREGAVLAPAGGSLNGLNYAGFWIRVAAYLIDYIVLMVVTYGLMFAIFGSTFMVMDPNRIQNMENDPEAAAAFIGIYTGIFFISFFGTALYKALMVWKWGGTLGKLAVGIKVVDIEGRPLSLGRAIGRAFAEMLNAFACSLTYLMPAFDDQKRGLHDHICATRVVHK